VAESVRALWDSPDEKQWRDALASYWENPSVRNNLEAEELMDKLDPELVRKFDSKGWHGFLRVYFNWKFKGTYLGKRLADLEKNKPEQLFAVKGLIFESDPKNVRRALERSEYIKGLGPAGGSGLLAVLFPKWFGTVDRFLVVALLEVPLLPERQKLLRMNPKSLTDGDAVLLIDILRKKAAQLNELFHTDEWTPRKIDMILWNLRDGQRCS
jgi:hypothetical protein